MKHKEKEEEEFCFENQCVEEEEECWIIKLMLIEILSGEAERVLSRTHCFIADCCLRTILYFVSNVRL